MRERIFKCLLCFSNAVGGRESLSVSKWERGREGERREGKREKGRERGEGKREKGRERGEGERERLLAVQSRWKADGLGQDGCFSLCCGSG